MKTYEILLPTELERLVDALKGLREKVQWKPGKDILHLEKRRRMGHLASHATLAEYEGIVSEVANNGQNVVYLYKIKEVYYYAIRGEAHGRLWLVIFGPKGLMETAFPPVDMDDYLDRRGFVLLGRIDEVLQWKESNSK
jgi:hypothetical protein